MNKLDRPYDITNSYEIVISNLIYLEVKADDEEEMYKKLITVLHDMQYTYNKNHDEAHVHDIDWIQQDVEILSVQSVVDE